MREQLNVTFEPIFGGALPTCTGSGTPGNAYGAAYEVHSYGQGDGSGGDASLGGGWVEAAQQSIGQIEARGGRGCARAMWPDRLGGVRFGACCPTEISFGRILPAYTRAAMQAAEEERQQAMLVEAKSALELEAAAHEYTGYGVVSTEQTRNPDVMPELSANYGGYRDYGMFQPDGSGYGSGSGSASGPFNGGRCAWR
jgi:hypothetical protein